MLLLKRNYAFVLLALTCCGGSLYAQPANRADTGSYLHKMYAFREAIQKNFYDSATGFYKEHVVPGKDEHPFSYLWPLCGMIQADNELEKVTGERDLVKTLLQTIHEYYDQQPPAPGYASYIVKYGSGDRFYDDNQWIGIACMDAYARQKSPLYLNQGKLIYRYMMTGFDTVLNGGIYWQENKKISKNTCSNGPAVLLALQLYKATQNQPYLDTALQLYNWTNAHLQAPSGLFYDNISVGSKRVDSTRFSYNTGTMLQSNVYLYELTRDKRYLDEAIAIADSSLSYFYSAGRFRDNVWFNAVMLRGFQHLLQHHPDKKYINAFRVCTDYALNNQMNELGVLGKNKPLELVPQSGMLEILARLALLEGQ